MYEDLANNNEYEYILPEIIVDKSLTNNKFGSIDFQSNLKMHNYDTNKVSKSLINDLNWNSQDFYFKSSIKNKFLTKIRNINYENKNIDQFKEDFTNELYGALALYSELSLEKETGLKKYNLKPKSFLRFAPGNMRKENSGQRLNTLSAFSIDRLNSLTNFETGLSGAFGFDYQIKDDNNEFNFSVAQIINEKKSEKHHKTSLNSKLSDLVGNANYKINDNFELNYNFSLDHNYDDLIYNELGTKTSFGPVSMKFDYLQEKKHIGDQDYLKAKIEIKNKDKGIFL